MENVVIERAHLEFGWTRGVREVPLYGCVIKSGGKWWGYMTDSIDPPILMSWALPGHESVDVGLFMRATPFGSAREAVEATRRAVRREARERTEEVVRKVPHAAARAAVWGLTMRAAGL